MGLISSLAAPQAPQFQSLSVKPVARITATLMTASPDQGQSPQTTAPRLGGAELPTEVALLPILAASSNEAIFRGLLPVPPALQQATAAADPKLGQIETLTEVDGISLDGIPYLNDGAVLLDDLPQPEPEPAPKAVVAPAAEPQTQLAMVQTTTQIATDAPEPLQLRSDQAERAYHDERAISAVRPEPAVSEPAPAQSQPAQTSSPQASPDQAEPAAVDKPA